MIITIISSNIEKSLSFVQDMMVSYHTFAQTFPDFSEDGDKYYIRSMGETSTRRICITVFAKISQKDDKVQLFLDTNNQMGSMMDCLIAIDRFVIGYKKHLEDKIKLETGSDTFKMLCVKYDNTDTWAICGNPSASLNMYIDGKVPFCFCEDNRHQPVCMGPDSCSFEVIHSKHV